MTVQYEIGVVGTDIPDNAVAAHLNVIGFSELHTLELFAVLCIIKITVKPINDFKKSYEGHV